MSIETDGKWFLQVEMDMTEIIEEVAEYLAEINQINTYLDNPVKFPRLCWREHSMPILAV